jgi:hypothetical protein
MEPPWPPHHETKHRKNRARTDRPPLNGAIRHPPTGSEIHGIVTSSQVGISPFPDVYAGFFSLLLARGSFSALARSETHI